MKRITFAAFMVICLLAAASLEAQSQSGMNFRQEGIASWYGPGFEGRPTASGEIFDPSQLTAAHPSLPFGTILTVTNTFNNRQVRVRVNDRGPFVASRIIDLSQAAAGILDMLVTGTAHVIIETNANPPPTPTPPSPNVQQPNPIIQNFYPPISQPAVPPAYTPYPYTPPAPPVQQQAPPQVVYTPPAYTPQPAPVQQPAPPPQNPAPVYIEPAYTPPAYQPPPPPPPAPIVPAVILGGIPAPGTGKLYRLQVGAYKIPRNAVETFDKLKAVGLNPAYERLDDMYRVVLSGVRPEEMQDISMKLGAAGIQEVILREER